MFGFVAATNAGWGKRSANFDGDLDELDDAQLVKRNAEPGWGKREAEPNAGWGKREASPEPAAGWGKRSAGKGGWGK